ncbi:hypothetical protein DFQ30_003285 [Apophysomyces sp. BC1015]|nr:hypothetical protein DFQ30_003285 [Apophysomyces sp. BC1015]
MSQQSLEEWLNRSSPSSPSSLLLESCRCCGQHDCDTLEKVNNTIKKLESDTRLAAEIGQSLLQKHELFALESSRAMANLQNQLDESRIQVHALEQVLQDAESAKQDLTEGKAKLARGCQKTQKALDEIVADLELANAKCAELSIDLELKNSEIEKLRIFKIMVRQADIREEALRSKLEDTRQELAIARKNELILESRQKKLKTRCESLSIACEKSKADLHGIHSESDLEWLRAYNEKLKGDIVKLTSNIIPANDMSGHLVSLIKELVSANSKLKLDLLGCREQLSETQSDLVALSGRLEEMENPVDFGPKRCNLPATATAETSRPRPPKPQVRRAASIREVKKTTNVGKQPVPRTKTLPSPTPSVSTPLSQNAAVIHHHYHHYVARGKKKSTGKDRAKGAEVKTAIDAEGTAVGSNCCNVLTDEPEQAAPEILIGPVPCSPSSSTTTSSNSSEDRSKPPYCALESHISQVLARLRATDIRALNRRLHRAFDMLELSNMSNSIIENVLVDVETLNTRFAWIQDKSLSVKEEKWREDMSLEYFFPIIRLFQDTLKEIGHLRVTMNELQVDYVKKVEESGLRVEEEIIRKQRLAQSAEKQVSPLAWLTSVFYRAATTAPPRSRRERSLVRSASNDDLTARSVRDRSTLAKTLTNITIDGDDEESIERYFHRTKNERFGPPSSFPKAIVQPTMRASQSTGSIRRRRPARGQLLALPQRNLSPSASTSWDIPRPTSPVPDVKWKVASGSFSTSWLGIGDK